MRTTRLNERDLTRIVRRVLREEYEMGGALPPKNDCFSNTTIRIPSSCKVTTTGSSIGTGGFRVGKDCLSDIGAMMTMNNLTEVSKLLMCLSTPILYKN